MSKKMIPFTAERAFKLLDKGTIRRQHQVQTEKKEREASGYVPMEHRRDLTKGQNPFAVIFGCSDSRFPPELVFRNREGDIFVIRTAGHVISDDALGSIEYAVEHLKVPLIVVMGHEKCEAVTAAVVGGEVSGHLGSIVQKIQPAIEKIKSKGDISITDAVNANVIETVAMLKSNEPILKELVDKGRLKIIGARCELETHKVTWFERLDPDS